MIKKAILEFSDKKYIIEINDDNIFAAEFIKYLPICSEAHNIGGEIYFRANGVDLVYDGNEKVEFKVKDVVYWRAPNGESKFAVAIFYGNTQYSNWKSPRASSACIKIGEMIDAIDDMPEIKSGDKVKLSLL